jgi:hypothetical protein
MRLICTACLLAASLGVTAPVSDYQRCKQKIEIIANGKAARGTRISLSPAELNAFLNSEVIQIIPGGVQSTRIELGYGTASGTAMVNFASMLQARGKTPGWLATKLIDGWKPLKGSIRLRSGNGWAQVDIERIELSGVTVPAFLVEFVVRQFVLPYSPDLKIGQPFALQSSIEHIEFQPSGFSVVMR